MYADGGLLFPYLQGGLDFYREAQQCQFQLQEEELLWRLQNSIFIDSSSSSSCNSLGSSTSSYEQGGHLPVVSAPTSGSTLIQASRVSEYDLGGEGDLFKAPEPILELPELAFDPMATAISMISGGEDITAGEVARVTAAEFDAMESSDPLLSEVFYECRKDLLANSAIEEPLEALGIEILELQGPGPEGVEEQQDLVQRDNRVGAATEGPLQKSVSSGCLLSSNDWGHGGGMPRPSFLGFQDVDLGAAFGLRRAYSEGDIKTLEAGNIGHVSTREILRSEERQQKLSRYRKKKEKRNFGRKIKYACRKALADSQPRVRGRFARTECESAKHQ